MTKQVFLYRMPELPQLPELQEPPKEIQRVAILNHSSLPAYLDSIQHYNPTARETLGKFGSQDGDLAGSNPFRLVHLANSGLLPSGERLAERPDLETAISYEPSFGKGNYIDCGLALVTGRDSYKPNNLLARKLAEQFKKRSIPLEAGKLLPFFILENEEDKDSAYGLSFRLKDDTSKESIRDLSDFKWDYGPRSEGLARACLNRVRGWFSSSNVLENSNSDGRVVVVSAEGTPQNFLDEFVAKLGEEKKRLESSLNQIRALQSTLRTFK
ncbi:MAG TPA: hypothetical protein VJJ21_01090 [Candidatus Nanoarchaeia archaeon]|nr:hypothetical protein [Candidatus Nanoarchaeia archaeon]